MNTWRVISTAICLAMSLTYCAFDVVHGFFVGHVYPELVDNEVGQKKIQNCRYVGK